MEKICIVKRRRENAQPEVKLILPDNQTDTLPQEVAVSNIAIDTSPEFSDKKTEAKLIQPDNQTDTLPQEVAVSSIAIDTSPEFSDKMIVEEFMDKSSSVISITMTKEQSELLRQSEYIKELLEGMKKDPSLDIKLSEDGHLSLNFHYNESMLLRMLSSNQVCQMLQISRSFLQKLVNEKKMNSYKLGRLRRFLLEDILEYLSNDAEFAQLKDKQ
jgi:excisionase family DNA binding protein